MKKTLLVSLIALLLCQFSMAEPVAPAEPATPQKLVVACVGDSITYGHGASKRDATSYPAVLQKLLGDEWEVHNFGHNARTALDEGVEWNGQKNLGYRKSHNFQKSKDCKPNFVIFMLGSNDSKKVNWEGKQEQFKHDYAALIDEYLALDPKPLVIIGTSSYVQKDRWQINEAVVGNEIVPWQREFAKERGLPVVEVYNIMKDNAADSFCDGIHPNDKGYALIAEAMAAKLREITK